MRGAAVPPLSSWRLQLRDRRWLSCVALFLATATCAGQAGQGGVGAGAPPSESLKDSEIRYTESGGIAGRVREARFTARDGKVIAEYGGPDLRAPEGLQAGNVENDAYVALWREAERLDLWTLASPAASKGADLVQSELTIRQGSRSKVIRWDETAAASDRLRDAAAWAQRVLEVAREYAALR
jgi:hypothetical protein